MSRKTLERLVAPPRKAVLDACVLFPASLRDILLRAAEAGMYKAHWSAAILEEVRRNLVLKGRANERQAERLIQMMDAAFPEATITGHESLISGMTNDPKDRHVLAAAVYAKVGTIVTSNLSDFPSTALEPHWVQAWHPDRFLTSLYRWNPGAMIRLIHEQSDSLSAPSMTPKEVLEALSLHVPHFSNLVLRGLP